MKHKPGQPDQSQKAIVFFLSQVLWEKESAEYLIPEMKNKVIKLIHMMKNNIINSWNALKTSF